MNTSYMLISISVSFRHVAILPGNGYNTVSFINLIKSVKLCLKVNLRILATRLVGACLTFLNICLLFLLHMNFSSSVYVSKKAAVN